MKLTVRLCKSARNARGINEKNKLMATRKKVGFLCRARYLPGIPKGVVRSRWSVDVIIVTKVIAMTKVNERKRSEGYVSGFLFLRKATAETAATAVTALCFSHCHKRSF